LVLAVLGLAPALVVVLGATVSATVALLDLAAGASAGFLLVLEVDLPAVAIVESPAKGRRNHANAARALSLTLIIA
jgi:hypothetical protein